MLEVRLGAGFTALRKPPNAFSIWVRFGFDKASRAFLNLPQACYAYRRMTDLACVSLRGWNS